MAVPKFSRPLPWCLSILVASACVCIGSTAAARAGSITYSTNTGNEAPGFLPYFDPELGTLKEVLFHVTGDVGAEFSFQNPVTSAVFDGGVSIFALDLSTDGAFVQFDSGGLTLTQNFDPPASSTVAELNFDFETSYQTGLDSFQRQGSYIVYPFGQIETPSGEITFRTESGAMVTVTYFFGVPEPPSAILLALGLVPVLIIGVYKARSLGQCEQHREQLAAH